MNIKKVICGIGASVLLSGALASNAAETERVIVFGDSLSDPGNYFAIYQEQEIQPFVSTSLGGTFVPSAPYAVGGNHFTNGETWVEILAQMLGDPQGGSPAALVPGTFSNYAVGRSRARANPAGVFSEVNLTTQVDAFLAIQQGVAPSEALYVIWIGANDVGDAITVALGGGDYTAILGAALNNIGYQVQRLYAAGARNFLLVNSPNFARTPLIQQLADAVGPAHDQVLAVAQGISLGFNGLYGSLAAGMNLLPGTSIDMLDVYGILEVVASSPEDYGIEVVDQSCLRPGVQGQAFCTQPSSYLFWDGIHPTTTVHGLLADEALQLLAE